jgi:hypothetical protein
MEINQRVLLDVILILIKGILLLVISPKHTYQLSKPLLSLPYSFSLNVKLNEFCYDFLRVEFLQFIVVHVKKREFLLVHVVLNENFSVFSDKEASCEFLDIDRSSSSHCEVVLNEFPLFSELVSSLDCNDWRTSFGLEFKSIKDLIELNSTFLLT